MLKRIQRIPRKEKIIKTSSFFTPFFILKVTKNSFSFNRYRFVISKKTEKKAVERNKIRRLFADCVKINNEKGFGKDIIFFINKKALFLSKEEICNNISGVFEKIKQ